MSRGRMGHGIVEVIRSGRWVDLRVFGLEVLRIRRKKLGLTQTEMANRIGIDQSRVSRYERGLTSPKDLSMAKAFAESYELDDEQTNEWYMLHAIKSQIKEFSPEFLLNLLNDQLETINRTRVRGDPGLALERATISTSRLELFLHQFSSANIFKWLQRMYGNFQIEMAISNLELCSPPDAVNVTKPFVNNIREIAKEIEDNELYGIAELLSGSSYYVAKEYGASAAVLQNTLDSIQDVDIELLLLRTLALDLGYLGNKDEFKKIETKSYQAIDKGEAELQQVCATLEGIGRAQGLLKSDDGYATLENAQQVYEKMLELNERAPMRIIQIANANLEITKSLGIKDYRQFEIIGTDAIQLAQSYGYTRHVEKIDRVLKEFLN